MLQGIKVPARQLRQLKGTISAATNLYEPTMFDEKLHADLTICEESRAGLLSMLGMSPRISRDPVLLGPDSDQWPPSILQCDNIQTAPQAAFEILRTTADSWGFSALEFESATGGNGLVTMAFWLFEQQGLMSKLSLDGQKLRLFLQKVQSGCAVLSQGNDLCAVRCACT